MKYECLTKPKTSNCTQDEKIGESKTNQQIYENVDLKSKPKKTHSKIFKVINSKWQLCSSISFLIFILWWIPQRSFGALKTF